MIGTAVVYSSDSENFSQQFAKQAQAMWDKKSFTDSDGTIFSTKISVSTTNERSKANVFLNARLPENELARYDYATNEILYPRSSLAGVSDNVHPHEFAHAFFGVNDAYHRVVMDDGTRIDGWPYSGFSNSIMGSTTKGAVRFEDLKPMILYLEKLQPTVRKSK